MKQNLNLTLKEVELLEVALTKDFNAQMTKGLFVGINDCAVVTNTYARLAQKLKAYKTKIIG